MSAIAPSPSSPGILTMSARPSAKTAAKANDAAQTIFQRTITVGSQRYLLWASTTVSGEQKSVGASEAEWQEIEKSLQPVLSTEKVKKVQTQVDIALEGDALVVTDHGNKEEIHKE
ncbi:MAG TPA: hypothetical protein VGM34_03755, partial [Chlamydiales bacterium]